MIDSQRITKSSCAFGANELDYQSLLNPEELELLQSKMVDVRFRKGEVVFKQGSFANNIIVLNEGLLKTYIEGPNERLVLQIFSPVKMIGLSALLENSHVRHHSAQVYVDSRISLIEISVVRQLMLSNAAFASRMVSLLAEQLIITSGRFYCLTMKQTYGRMADVILCLANRVYKSNNFPLQLSRKDFSELTGMTIESVSRIFTKFKNDNIIKIENDFVEILDNEKLELISLKG
jgi:CRP/FNR family transcriptional regulator, polysaccharide utilization system transcription regulator